MRLDREVFVDETGSEKEHVKQAGQHSSSPELEVRERRYDVDHLDDF